MNSQRLIKMWAGAWMRLAGAGFPNSIASRLAGLFYPPFYGRVPLAKFHPRGFRSPTAVLSHPLLKLGRYCFIGDDVLIYQDRKGAGVTLEDGVHLHRHCVLQTGEAGSITIGEHTHVQPGCQFSAYKGPIQIGARVEIAPNCAFYPYNHGVRSGIAVRDQPLVSKGGIVIGDDAWLGYGVIVLDGARIGMDAVIGAGSIVTGEIPDGAIAAGSPAKVLKLRD
jgi:acetyltransferase-like isoleucine patch superfamily enzyme